MATNIIMPKQGLQMTEGTIIEWLKQEGEYVKEGEPLFSMETDKLTITIDAAATGTLLKIVRGENEVVPITETIAIIGEPGEDFSALLTDIQDQPQVAAVPEKTTTVPMETEPQVSSTGNETHKRFISPRARRTAEEKKIDIETLTGSGPEGMIVERDVLQAMRAPKASPLAKKLSKTEDVALDGVTGSGARGKIMAADIRAARAAKAAGAEVIRGSHKVKLTGMRKVVATRMHESLTEMAQANHRMTVNMTEATRLRNQYKANGIKVSYNDIVMRCTARALMEHPEMNVSFHEDGIEFKEYVNMGMAVALDSGLIVPVIKDADLMTLEELSTAAKDLAERAKTNRLQPDEYTGGTFTVSNLGMFGVDDFTAIVNPPEAGILAVGRIQKQVVVLDDDTTEIHPLLQLSLTYDHRAIDGAGAAKFLQCVKKYLEAPGLLV